MVTLKDNAKKVHGGKEGTYIFDKKYSAWVQQDEGGNSMWFVKSVQHWMIGESGNRGRNLDNDGIRSSVVTESMLPYNVDIWEYFTKGRLYGGQWTVGNRNEIQIIQGKSNQTVL